MEPLSIVKEHNGAQEDKLPSSTGTSNCYYTTSTGIACDQARPVRLQIPNQLDEGSPLESFKIQSTLLDFDAVVGSGSGGRFLSVECLYKAYSVCPSRGTVGLLRRSSGTT